VTGPGRSNHALGAEGRSRARESATTTSSIAIGCVRDFSQRGNTITGRRAARSRTISQLRLPYPTIMLARSSMVSTAPARSASPTASRLRRCSEAARAAATPPRYTIAPTPARAAASAKVEAAARSRST
jgi:hypothetical protein